MRTCSTVASRALASTSCARASPAGTTCSADGRRQIIGFVLPGDLCDSRATMFEHVDFSVSAIDAVEAILIPAETLRDRVNGSASLLRAICRLAAIEDAIDRRWLLNIGHRTALERVAHLLLRNLHASADRRSHARRPCATCRSSPGP